MMAAASQSSQGSGNESARGIWLTAKWFLSRDARYAVALEEWERTIPPPPEDLALFAAGFFGLPLDFILLHELQHVLCGHLNETAAVFLSSIDNAEPQGVAQYTVSIQREFEADAGATRVFARDPASVRVGAIAACEIFFLFLHVVQELSADPYVETTHPSARRRLLAIRSLYEMTTGGIKGFGAGFRRIMDAMFEMDLEMFREFPEEVWLSSNAWQLLAERYAQGVLEGSLATHVTFGGELAEALADAIQRRAQGRVGEAAFVHIGVLNSARPLLPELSAVAGIVGGVAAVISLCVQLFQLRREALRRGSWTADELKLTVERQLAQEGEEGCECVAIENFDEQVARDGDLCEIVLREKKTGREYEIQVSARAATWSLYIVLKPVSGHPSNVG